jgi:hypothetical protein
VSASRPFDLAAIRDRWRDLTPGPWRYTAGVLVSAYGQPVAQTHCDDGTGTDFPNATANGHALASAPDDVRALVGEVQRLTNALATMTERRDRARARAEAAEAHVARVVAGLEHLRDTAAFQPTEDDG